MRAAGAKRCVLLGIIIDTKANKDLRFGNEIDCGTMVVRCFSIVPTTCLQSKYTPSPSIIVFIDALLTRVEYSSQAKESHASP